MPEMYATVEGVVVVAEGGAIVMDRAYVKEMHLWRFRFPLRL